MTEILPIPIRSTTLCAFWLAAVACATSLTADDAPPVKGDAAFQQVRTFEMPANFEKVPATLPIYRYLKAIGLTPVPAGANADLRCGIVKNDKAIGAQYSNGFFQAGAEVTVVFDLQWGEQKLNRNYRGVIEPPEKIVLVDSRPYPTPFALALEASGFPHAACDLMGQLRQLPPDQHRAAIAVATAHWSDCAKLGASVVGPLLAVLDDIHGEYRTSVAKALGERKDQRIVPALAKALARETQPDVFVTLCRAMLASDDSSGGQTLLQLLEHQPANQQEACVKVLTESKSAANLAAVVRFVLRDKRPDAFRWRVDVLESFRFNGSEGDAAGAPIVTLALDTFRESNWRRFGLNEQSATTTRYNLRLDTMDACRGPLRAAIQQGDADLRILALAWLGELKDEYARQPAAALLNDADPKLRRAAVRFFRTIDYGALTRNDPTLDGPLALGNDAAESSLRVLPSALHDPDQRVRIEALQGLMEQDWRPQNAVEHRVADSVWQEMPAEEKSPVTGDHPWGPPPWDLKVVFFVLLGLASGGGVVFFFLRTRSRLGRKAR